MHNCRFLTILNELTFLLYPLDTRCVLNLVLNNVFFLWSMNVVYLGTLLVHLLSYISLKMKGTAMCWWCSSVAFPFITPRDTILFVNRKEAWRKSVLLWNYVRGEKKKSEQYLTVQIASEFCNGSVACIPQPKLCKWAESEYLRKDSSLTQSICFKAGVTFFLRPWSCRGSTPS